MSWSSDRRQRLIKIADGALPRHANVQHAATGFRLLRMIHRKILLAAALSFMASSVHAQDQPPQRMTVATLLQDYYDGASEGRRTRAKETSEKAPPLPKDKVKSVIEALWAAYQKSPEAILRKGAAAGSICVVDGEPLYYVMKKDGERGPNGYSVYIDMHGGGGGPPEMNDGDWKVHQTRYKTDGKFLAVRAPRDTWDQFHNEYFHRFIDALAEQMIVAEDADPNRIYIMGFSSGAYGTIQLGPALADRLAASATSAAATEGMRPENLRNLPWIYQVGEKDTMYDRAGLAQKTAAEMKTLHDADPKGYEYYFELKKGMGHGFDDRGVTAWMAKYTRKPYPDKVVWWQNQPGRESSNPVRHQWYWLAIDSDFKRDASGTKKIVAERDGQTIKLTVEGYKKVYVRLNDEMVDLDQPVTILVNGEKAFEGKAERKLSTLVKTFEEKKDVTYAFPAEIAVEVK